MQRLQQVAIVTLYFIPYMKLLFIVTTRDWDIGYGTYLACELSFNSLLFTPYHLQELIIKEGESCCHISTNKLMTSLKLFSAFKLLEETKISFKHEVGNNKAC